MRKKPLMTAALAAVTLLGCGSFNSYQYPPSVVMVLPTAKAIRTTSTPATIANCVYTPPEVDTPPAVPLKELALIDRHDDEAMDDLQQKHIADLRSYITRYRQLHEAAYKDYLKRCGLVSGKNTG